MKQNYCVFFFILIIHTISAQKQKDAPPIFSDFSSHMKVVAPLSSRSFLQKSFSFEKEILDGRSSRNGAIIGKGSKGDDILSKNPDPLSQSIIGKTPEMVFDAAFSNSQPSDPSLAIGLNHVVVVFNTGYKIYDKNGNPLTEQLAESTIFDSGGCCDLTAAYDAIADRWVLSLLFFNGNVQVAVSRDSNPITSSWSVYTFPNINDYQKLSVWSDGYYLTANVNSASADVDTAVFALDRSAMLAGDDSAAIIGFPLPGISTPPSSFSNTGGFYSPQVFNISDKVIPSPGNTPVVFFQDDAFVDIDTDHLKIWTINVDFGNPLQSTISTPTELPTTPFVSVFDGGAFDNLPQPGGGSDIDVIQGTIMNQAQFRKFPTHNSAVFNFVVDTQGVGERAGIRWYELRQTADGEPWSIYQEGTYSSPNGKSAWMGSMIMDDLGNIAMGYGAMGGTTNTHYSSYYTGRFANDPLNTMTISETLIAEGNSSFPSLRCGDYAKIDIDPTTDRKFWFINEYMSSSGRADVVGVFQIAADVTTDIGIVSLDLPLQGSFSDTEEIEVTIFNYGQNPVTNFDVTYQINDNTAVTETFTGTIPSNTSSNFIFSQTADLSEQGQTYIITVSTNLDMDAQIINDSLTQNITSIFTDDIGILDFTTPIIKGNLGNENVSVTIKNFGTNPFSDFDISFYVNDIFQGTERVNETILANGTISYTSQLTVDLNEPNTYTIEAILETSDNDSSNNSKTFTVQSLPCNGISNTQSQPITPDSSSTITSTINVQDSFVIGDANIQINIEHEYVSDLIISLQSPTGTIVELTSANGGSADDYTNTLFDDQATTPITEGNPPYTGSFIPEQPLSNFEGEEALGEWTLTITDRFVFDGGQLIDWNLELCADQVLATTEVLPQSGELMILYKSHNQYEIQYITDEINERLALDIFDITGQRVLHYRLDKNQGMYQYPLDMSYASSGMYLIRISTLDGSKNTFNKLVKK